MAIMTALTTAVSGIKSSQTSLDVIANNIANVNTTGYKAQSVSFSDILSQTISSGSSATATRGGTNPVQLGLGVAVSSTNTDLTVGSTSSSSNALDLALTGSGYFIVKGGSSGEYQFTRAGNMTVDDAGNLTVNGYQVCGWQAYTLDADGNKVFNTDGTVEAINIYSDSYAGNKQIMAAKASTAADFSGSLDSTATVVSGASLKDIGSTAISSWDATTSIDVVDAQGNTTEVTINWKKCATDGTTTSWYWQAAGDATISPASGYVAFDANGNMVDSVTPLTATVGAVNTAGYSDSDISVSTGLSAGDYTITVTDSTTTSGTYDIVLTDAAGNSYTAAASADGSATFSTTEGTVTLAAPSSLATGTTEFTVAEGTALAFDTTPAITVASTAGTNAVSVELDFSTLTTTANGTGLSGSADGYESGSLQSVSVSSDGTITGIYSNDQTQSIAQISLAVFQNAAGLSKIGSNLYAASSSSGDYSTVVAGSGGSGAMTSYALELSNVDLAAQFSAMMISQRAYQANTKVISTSDDMLQSLINMV
ncbi:MAG: flagellar hook-basal body complex protein [Sporomusaceae bacterium]|nr:flagellar hook-basal body complex protein [Sporomusaceae bacterium]